MAEGGEKYEMEKIKVDDRVHDRVDDRVDIFAGGDQMMPSKKHQLIVATAQKRRTPLNHMKIHHMLSMKGRSRRKSG